MLNLKPDKNNGMELNTVNDYYTHSTVEKWASVHVPELSEFYQVSTLGRVRSLPRIVRRNSRWGKPVSQPVPGKILSQSFDNYGYLKVNMSLDGKVYTVTVHRLVAMAFLPKKPSDTQVNHINGIKAQNDTSNLEWCTCIENIRHSITTGLKGSQKSHRNNNFKGVVIATEVATGKVKSLRGCREMICAGFIPTKVYDCLRGKGKTHYGYSFRRQGEGRSC
ncbi:NUMOD4 domain-containing protein [Salmonella enterica]